MPIFTISDSLFSIQIPIPNCPWADFKALKVYSKVPIKRFGTPILYMFFKVICLVEIKINTLIYG